MAIQYQAISPVGMRQDNIISGDKQSNTHAFEIKNLRFNTIDDITSAVWTTEKGTLKKELRNAIEDKEKRARLDNILNNLSLFKPIGDAVINDQWIIFGIYNGNDNPITDMDLILKLWYDDNERLCVDLLYIGKLRFSLDHPIETLPFYENDEIQKVYWLDGINQPRMINISNVKNWYGHDDQFDFIKKVDLTERIIVNKEKGSTGQFPAGTVKYAITYYNKYGQQSNIIWTSTLLYPTIKDRGCTPDELSGDCFIINVSNISQYMKESWDYMRLYSIVRTSNGATPIVKIVEDKPLKDDITNEYYKTIEFRDTNTLGETIDPTELLFIGGKEITAETFDQKDNTLFLGNITLKRESLQELMEECGLTDNDWFIKKEGSEDIDQDAKGFVSTNSKVINVTKESNVSDLSGDFYPWSNQLDDTKYDIYNTIVHGLEVPLFYETLKNPKIFKWREVYRFGIQFQDERGVWSEVHHLCDSTNNIMPKFPSQSDIMSTRTKFGVFRYVLPSNIINILRNNNPNDPNYDPYRTKYKKARLVCCYPTNANRRVLAQGVLAPTIENNKWSKDHTPDALSSYFFQFGDCDRQEFQFDIQSFFDDICNGMRDNVKSSIYGFLDNEKTNNSLFHINKNILTLHSPEFQYDDTIKTLDLSNAKIRVIGETPGTSLVGKMYLDSDKQAFDYLQNKGDGFIKNDINYGYRYDLSYNPVTINGTTRQCTLVSKRVPMSTKMNPLGIWNDIDVYNANAIFSDREAEKGAGQFDFLKYDYYIYPFQRKYLNNYMGDLTIRMYQEGKDPEYTVEESSIIKEKTWSYLRHSLNNKYFDHLDTTSRLVSGGFVEQNCDIKNLLDIQFVNSIGEFPIRLKNGSITDKYDIYFGNINSFAPTCNYDEIWNLIATKSPYNGYFDPKTLKLNNIQGYYTLYGTASNGGPNATLLTPIWVYQGLNIINPFFEYEHNEAKLAYFNVTTNWQAWNDNLNAFAYASFILSGGFTYLTGMLNGAINSYEDDAIQLDRNYFGAFGSKEQTIQEYSGVYQIQLLDQRFYVNETGQNTPDEKSGLLYTKSLQPRPKFGRHLLSKPRCICSVFDRNDSGTRLSRSMWPVGVSSDLVPFSYKSTEHVVLSTKNNYVGPYTPYYNLGVTSREYKNGGPYPVQDVEQKCYGSLWMAELYRDIPYDDDDLIDPTFGSDSVYVPCSRVYTLPGNGNDLEMIHDEGDTYYMRYDHLKTYPYEEPSINGIVDIFSFMCETRINLDGRCDDNRAMIDNTIMRPSNFGVINRSYTQTDNYFSYQEYSDLDNELTKFANQITWTKTKTSGELIDTWTNITMVNTADADGVSGEITKITNYNNTLLLFQDHAIAQIGYNEKAALSTEQGIPIELNNSGKFTGFAYINKILGCQNKWSISNMNNTGLVFIDDSRNEMNKFSSEGMQPISSLEGFESFFINNLKDVTKMWTPKEHKNFKALYDKISKDVMYVNDNNCLAYNERVGTFTSFYDYNAIPILNTIKKHTLTFRDGNFWALREDDRYSYFFDKFEPYWITLMSNGGDYPTLDKVFNYVEYRADLFDAQEIVDGWQVNANVFTDIAAWTSYQTYKEFNITGQKTREYPWQSERKFNIWRTTIPRATYKREGGILETNRDRIRNPFCFIKLKNSHPELNKFPEGVNAHRMILHNFVVYYDIK